MPRLRTWIVLGRISNLPTIWSNCLAGWWLGGAENRSALPWLFAGVTLLYVGGMFLNDAFDAEFDQEHRKERPIPSGAISSVAVRRIGLALLAAGALGLLPLGTRTGALGVVLLACIIVYDAVHKVFTLSPLLMAACRFLVYAVAASSVANGTLPGRAIWCGLALGIYVAGLSFFARIESTGGAARYWPALLLGVPVLLALLMNAGKYREPALLWSAVLVLWVVRCARNALSVTHRDIGRAVSGLLAGIVFVDLVAVCDAPRTLAFVLLALFATALLLQRFVPAT